MRNKFQRKKKNQIITVNKKGKKKGSGNHGQHKKMCTDKEIIRAIKRSNGFLGYAAEMLGITYQAVWNRMKRNKKIKNRMLAVREKHLDFSERQLIENIKKGKEQSIFFHLKCLGKKRGYVERQEIAGVRGRPIEMTLEHRLSQIEKEREIGIQKAIRQGEYVGDRSLQTETGERVYVNGRDG